MNKKAIFAYVILFVFVAIGSYYVYHSNIGGGSTSGATTMYTSTITIAANNTQQYNQSAANLTVNSTKDTGTGSIEYCTAAAEYACSGISLSGSAGTLSVTFSQYTGLTWSHARVFFLNRSEIADVAGYRSYSASGEEVLNVSTGSPVTAEMSVISPNSSVGTIVVGQVWAAYQTGNSTVYYGRIANVSASAS